MINQNTFLIQEKTYCYVNFDYASIIYSVFSIFTKFVNGMANTFTDSDD